jgi:Kdo2-lipid IVA lauroyltransferase/acyltransferase
MNPQNLSTKTRWLYRLLRALAWLPRPVCWWLSRAVAWLMAVLGSRAARVTNENLSLCYPALTPESRRALTLNSLNHTLYMLFELSRIWTWDWVRQQKTIRVSATSEALLQEALADDRGVVVLAPHLGNWELLGFYLQSKAPLTVLYQPGDSESVNELMLACRATYGTRVVPTNRQGVMQLFKALKRGGMTGILPDQVPEKDSGGQFAPFFGVQAMTMTLVYNLIQRTNCRILCGSCLRRPGGFEMLFTEPDAAIYSVDEQTSLAGLNASVEHMVRAAPEQYQWEYKRFRRLQPGETKRYHYKK